jgi:hypothetical protein
LFVVRCGSGSRPRAVAFPRLQTLWGCGGRRPPAVVIIGRLQARGYGRRLAISEGLLALLGRGGTSPERLLLALLLGRLRALLCPQTRRHDAEG